jgi:exopolysaccharide biosynthesis polyprenyl glycosylphosphotransferase
MDSKSGLGRHPEIAPIGLPTQRTGATAGTRASINISAARPSWQLRYRGAVIASDLLSVVLSSACYLLWGNAPFAEATVTGILVVPLSAIALLMARAWDPAVLGVGAVEFSRLLRGMLGAAVTIGLFSLASEMTSGRPWVFGVLPVAGALAVAGRLVLRKRLHRLRGIGQAMASVLAVGTEESVASFIQRTRRAPHHGWTVVGVCTTTGTGPRGAPEVEGVPVLGDLDSVAVLARTRSFDAVSVGQAPGWTSRRLQRLAWDLEGKGTELVVDPGLMEIAGPRLHMATVDGLPLLRLTHPKFTGVSKFLKGGLDRVGALGILTLLSPVLLVLAILVKRDGGPVFFRQKRVGLDGSEFDMVKFRSMVVDAEARLAELQAVNEGSGLLFKMRHDPRITAIGRVLRRYSLDELPQLFNVVAGSMSLVGPRPPLPREVEGYERDARRRLMVKPGMTGLWQVSGRSDLSWEETIRLDLRYVENWTLALDAQILVRTVRAVVRGGGAY